jgi:uncharacterized protein (DUF2132 family)
LILEPFLVSFTGHFPLAILESQPKNPLHGIRLDSILNHLVDTYGWKELGERITIKCFTDNPSVKSSLTFLRKTPWARERVEGLYLKSIRDAKKEKPEDENEK